jgi:protein TonB
VITLTGFILLSHFIKGVDFVTRAVDVVDVKIEVADIPQTKQLRKPPPPARPSLPVPTEDDMVPEDLTIASTELDLTDIPAPPPPPVDDEMPIFVAYDEPPLIIGGLQSLMTHLRYPRLAQAASVEGIVYVKILVGSDGSTEKVEIIKSTVSGMGFEDSAIDALNKVKWQPAKQRDRNIRVWVSMPVQFKLMS